jgi:fibro-slime domain-containing protein
LNVPSPETISFNLGADDDAFVYVDGNIVCQLGGVHTNAPGTCTSATLTTGNHTLQLFYADIQTHQASLTFSVTTANVTGDPTTTIGQDGPYQIGYAANLNIGDSVVNFSNDGAQGGFDPNTGGAGNLCVNVYTFDPAEEEISCCSCLVTPNGLNSLSVKSDLINNTLTPAIPNSILVKLTSSTPAAAVNGNLTVCNPATVATTANGMLAWGSTLEPAASPTTYGVVNVPYINGSLSASELSSLTAICSFIQSDGTGFGLCGSCGLGALGGAKK